MKIPPGMAIAMAAVLMAAAGFGVARWWTSTRVPVTLTSGSLLSPPRDLPQFSLIDHHGTAFTPASFQGHWSVLFFGYTNCPDLCPTTLATLATLQREWQSRNVAHPQVVFVSVDVRRDTPAVLAKYVPYFDPSFIGVTATTQARIEEFARSLGAAVIIGPEHDGTYSVDHTGALFVVSPRGRLAAILTPPYTVAGLRGDLARILSAGA